MLPGNEAPRAGICEAEWGPQGGQCCQHPPHLGSLPSFFPARQPDVMSGPPQRYPLTSWLVPSSNSLQVLGGAPQESGGKGVQILLQHTRKPSWNLLPSRDHPGRDPPGPFSGVQEGLEGLGLVKMLGSPRGRGQYSQALMWFGGPDWPHWRFQCWPTHICRC